MGAYEHFIEVSTRRRVRRTRRRLGHIEHNNSTSDLNQDRQAKWNAAVRAELTRAGEMEFALEWDANGRIVDLICTAATPSVAQLLGELNVAIVGRRLRDLMADRPHKDELIAAYLDVANSGRSSTHWTVRSFGNQARLVLHDISRPGNDILIAHLRDPLAVRADAPPSDSF